MYTCGGQPYRFLKFNPAWEQLAQFGLGQVLGQPGGERGGNGIAITDGRLYSASSGTGVDSAVQAFPLPEPGPLPDDQHVENLLPTTATLAATLNPEGHATTYRFEYGTTDSYGQSTPILSLPGTGFDSAAVTAPIVGLFPATTYHFHLVASSHCNPAVPAEVCTAEGADTTFTTLPAVGIEAQWPTDLTSNSVRLHAELDPLGVAADWWIEYGTTESYGSKTAEGALPAGFGAVPVSTLITGLKTGTPYHFRFAARDERGGTIYTVYGSDRSFITQIGGLGFRLPDERAWEMVSPPEKFGGLILPAKEGHIQAAADGSGLAYLSLLSIEAAPEGNRALEFSSVLANRGAGGSWRSKDIMPPNGDAIGYLNSGSEYKLFTPDLGTSLLQPRGTTPLSPMASERTPYLRQNTEPATYTPLVTGKEGFANVPPGTVFGAD